MARTWWLALLIGRIAALVVAGMVYAATGSAGLVVVIGIPLIVGISLGLDAIYLRRRDENGTKHEDEDIKVGRCDE
jgi:hypothetical protein